MPLSTGGAPELRPSTSALEEIHARQRQGRPDPRGQGRGGAGADRSRGRGTDCRTTGRSGGGYEFGACEERREAAESMSPSETQDIEGSGAALSSGYFLLRGTSAELRFDLTIGGEPIQ